MSITSIIILVRQGAMSNRLTSQTYDELYDGLLQTQVWLQSVGLPVTGNRFAAILANVDLIRQHYDKPSLDQVLHEHPMGELWVSLLDAGSFITLYEQLRALRSDQLPRGRLKEALSGPLMPHDEQKDGPTIQARDAIFELELGCRLRAKGVSLTGFDDIEFEFQGVRVNVQCKRLHSAKTLQPNLDKACMQIARWITGQTRGLVAIGMDKIFTTDRNVLTVTNEGALLGAVKDLMKDFLCENEQRFLRILDIRILGVLADLRYIGRVKDRNDLLTSGCETALYALASAATLQFVDSDFLWNLGHNIADSVEQLHPLRRG